VCIKLVALHIIGTQEVARSFKKVGGPCFREFRTGRGLSRGIRYAQCLLQHNTRNVRRIKPLWVHERFHAV